jgi:hypothetical protein
MNNKELSKSMFNNRTYRLYLRGESIKKIFNLGDVNKDYINFLSSKWFVSNDYKYVEYNSMLDCGDIDNYYTNEIDDFYSITSYDSSWK